MMLCYILLLAGLSYEAAASSAGVTGFPFKKGHSVQGCRLPDFPTNGKYVTLHNDKKMAPGDLAAPYTVLMYSCDTDFDLTIQASVCTSENTWSTTPACLKHCSMVNSSSVNFECFSPKGTNTPCSANMPSGSMVLTSCKEGFFAMGQNLPVLTCLDGSWDEDTPACDPNLSCVTGSSCTPMAAPQGTSSQPSSDTDKDVHALSLDDVAAQNVILGNKLQEYNTTVREQLRNISDWQADMVQVHLLQASRVNEVEALLEKQKQDNSMLRAELESLKTSLTQEMAKLRADSDSQQLKSELDLLKATQTREVAKLNSEISKWKTELEALKTARKTPAVSKNLGTPYRMPIPDGVQPGWSVTVSGEMLPEANVFAINFECRPNNCIAFHFRPYFAPRAYIVRNHFHNGAWANEETSGASPLLRSQPFQITITVESDGFKVDIDNKNFCHFNHRLPYQGINNFLIVGDAILTSVTVN